MERRTGADVPNTGGLAIVRVLRHVHGDDTSTIRREGARADAGDVAFHADGDEIFVIPREGDADDLAHLALQGENGAARARVPQAGSTIHGGGDDESTVGGERGAVDAVGRSAKGAQDHSRTGVPEA